MDNHADWQSFLQTVTPIHQEFFCRVVEAYPRLNDGSLGSVIHGAERILELFILRNLAVCHIYFPYVFRY
jgi:hypothetical protein